MWEERALPREVHQGWPPLGALKRRTGQGKLDNGAGLLTKGEGDGSFEI